MSYWVVRCWKESEEDVRVRVNQVAGFQRHGDVG